MEYSVARLVLFHQDQQQRDHEPETLKWPWDGIQPGLLAVPDCSNFWTFRPQLSSSVCDRAKLHGGRVVSWWHSGLEPPGWNPDPRHEGWISSLLRPQSFRPPWSVQNRAIQHAIEAEAPVKSTGYWCTGSYRVLLQPWRWTARSGKPIGSAALNPKRRGESALQSTATTR